MPLLDHFRPPVSARHGWPGFLTGWAVHIAAELNAVLPQRFLAESPAQLGIRVAEEVAEFEPLAASREAASGSNPATSSPPRTRFTAPLAFPDTFPVEVRDLDQARLLVAVMELVSPSNKNRPAHREFFAAKVGSYLTAGVGVVVVDIVTTMHFNLHDELIRVGGWDAGLRMPAGTNTYAAAYQPLSGDGQDVCDMWPHPLAVGDRLPEVPLALRGYGCVKLDLEATYAESCRRARIG